MTGNDIGKNDLGGGFEDDVHGRIVGTGDARTATFDGDGKALTDIGGSAKARGLAIQPDGKIVAAGQRTTGGLPDDTIALVRYHDAVRLYVQQDANFNVTAVTDSDGVVLERYVYEPYGSFTVLNADWSADEDGQSDYGQTHLHQGGRYDAVSGLYHFRNRDYSPSLGRWVQQDPMGYVDGMSLYEYVRGGPSSGLDPRGSATVRSGPPAAQPAGPPTTQPVGPVFPIPDPDLDSDDDPAAMLEIALIPHNLYAWGKAAGIEVRVTATVQGSYARNGNAPDPAEGFLLISTDEVVHRFDFPVPPKNENGIPTSGPRAMARYFIELEPRPCGWQTGDGQIWVVYKRNIGDYNGTWRNGVIQIYDFSYSYSESQSFQYKVSLTQEERHGLLPSPFPTPEGTTHNKADQYFPPSTVYHGPEGHH